MKDSFKAAAKRLKEAQKICVLTGAGISADSGVPTFRGKDGLWREMRGEELASIDLLEQNPLLAWQWYDAMRAVIAEKKPNPAHLALAQLQKKKPGLVLATQNIDGYHTAAGNKDVLELHGNFWRLSCMKCGKLSENRVAPMEKLPPKCVCGGLLRPDIVLYGEQLPAGALRLAFESARNCDLCLVVGTSCVVYPAALIPQEAKSAGAFILELNPESTPLSAYADLRLRGNAADILPQLIE